MFFHTPLAASPVYGYGSPYGIAAPYDHSTNYLDAAVQQAECEYAAASARVRAFQQQRESHFRRNGPPAHTFLPHSRPQYAHAWCPYATGDAGSPQLEHAAHWRGFRPQHHTAREDALFALQQQRARAVRHRQALQAFTLAEIEREAAAVERRRRAAELQNRRQQEQQRAWVAMLLQLVAGQVTPAATRPRDDAFSRLERETNPAVVAAVQDGFAQLLALAVPQQPAPVPTAAPQEFAPVDPKGKGKAVHFADEPVAAPATTTSAPPAVPSLKEELEARIRLEADSEVLASLHTLYADIFGAPYRGGNTSTQDANGAGPSGTIHQPTAPAPTSLATSEPSPDVAARTTALAQIAEVESALHRISTDFAFPTTLDFSAAAAADLPYTARNAPIHAHEHALSGLLAQLDALESGGDDAVRARRKEVVRAVEGALAEMERRVAEGRGSVEDKEDKPDVSVDFKAAVVEDAVSRGGVVPDVPLAPAESSGAELAEAVEPSTIGESQDGAVADLVEAVSTSAHDMPFAPVPPSADVLDVGAAPTEDVPPATEEHDTPDVTAEDLSDTAVPADEAVIDTPPSPVLSTADLPDVDVDGDVITPLEPLTDIEASPSATSVVALDAPAAVADADPRHDEIAAAHIDVETLLTEDILVPIENVDTRDAPTAPPQDKVEETTALDAGSPALSPTAPTPGSPSPSSDGGEDTFLLASHPLADEPPRKPSATEQEDSDGELIGREDLVEAAEQAESASDWSDLDA